MRGTKRDTLGKRLLRLRLRSGLSVSELARYAGLKSTAHVGLIERGERRDVAASTALALARVLGSTVEWLVAGLGQEPTDAQVRAAVAQLTADAEAST